MREVPRWRGKGEERGVFISLGESGCIQLWGQQFWERKKALGIDLHCILRNTHILVACRKGLVPLILCDVIEYVTVPQSLPILMFKIVFLNISFLKVSYSGYVLLIPKTNWFRCGFLSLVCTVPSHPQEHATSSQRPAVIFLFQEDSLATSATYTYYIISRCREEYLSG